MCGIAGFFDHPGKVQEDRLGKAITCLKDRGPDHNGIWINEDRSAGLVHTRLAIIDLNSRANQPFNYLGRYRIVYNGEIYNYEHLRKELERKYALIFTTTSDTEVIIASYHIYKENCLEYFNGMFAFAIYDQEEQTVFCARDRFGEKPFFYHRNKEQFFFASKPASLHSYGVPRMINKKLLLHYLGAGQTNIAADQSASFFENIASLPPAHYILHNRKNNEFKVNRYWSIDPSKKKLPGGNQSEEEFYSLFQSSVLQKLRSDVKLGASISGGLDSSSIAYIISTVNKQQLTGFSAVFPGFDKDETLYINLLKSSLDLETHFVSPDANDLQSHFFKMVRAHDHPIADPSSFAQYMVFLKAKQHGYSVMIDGQGADEILAGYSKYNHWAMQELVSKNRPAEAFKLYRDLKHNEQEIKGGYLNFLLPYFLQSINKKLVGRYVSGIKQNNWLEEEFVQAYLHEKDILKPTVHSLRDIQLFDITNLGLQELLRYADSNSMAHGVEVRLPFLDHQLVTYAMDLPVEYKIHNGFNKYILRKSMDKKLPDAITWRKRKVGYEVPTRQWMSERFMQDVFEDSLKTLSGEGFVKMKKPMSDTSAQWRIAVAGQLLNPS